VYIDKLRNQPNHGQFYRVSTKQISANQRYLREDLNCFFPLITQINAE
jgi:hypothetical protein